MLAITSFSGATVAVSIDAGAAQTCGVKSKFNMRPKILKVMLNT